VRLVSVQENSTKSKLYDGLFLSFHNYLKLIGFNLLSIVSQKLHL
jgi:hypothetical protein